MDILIINLFKLLFIFLVAFLGGLAIKYKGLKVGFTRKINHFFLFFAPSLINNFFGLGESLAFWIGEAIFFLGSFLIFIKPIRSRISFIATAFSSFDRPEDRPYTILWFVIQELSGYLILLPAIHIYEKYQISALLSIPILVSVFGDGLAEPIGLVLGKHRYLTYAIFTRKRYLRTLEGSAVVFLSAVIIIIFFYKEFSLNQFLLALFTLPLSLTLAEALSPHTLDNPFITLTGFINLFFIKQFI